MTTSLRFSALGAGATPQPAVERRVVRGLAVAVAALALTACGGEQEEGTKAASSPVAKAMATSLSGSEGIQTFLNWAEQAFPQYFPGHQPNQSYDGVVYRHYTDTGNFVGVLGERVLIMGPISGGPVVDLGAMGDFACLVSPQSCASERPMEVRQNRIAAGPGHTLVVNAQGAGLGWGDGLAGASGVDIPGTPARAISGLNQVAGLSNGDGFTLATTRDGQLLYLHHGAKFPLVPGADRQPYTAVPVPGASQVVAAASCGHSRGALQAFALRSDGSVWTFGVDAQGVLESPYLVTSGVVRGFGASNPWRTADDAPCVVTAVKADGSVLALEHRYRNQPKTGQVGHFFEATTLSAPLSPQPVDVACSPTHCLVVNSAGLVVGWGDNQDGQLGLDPRRDPSSPSLTPVNGLSGITRVWATVGASYALAADGTFYAWGAKHVGPNRSAPGHTIRTQFSEQGPIADVAIHDHLVLLMRDGTLRTWGANALAQLGTGDRIAPASAVQPAGLALGAPASTARPPVARIAEIKATELPMGSSLALSDGGSRDADGDRLTWNWSLAAKPENSAAAFTTPTSPTTQITLDRPGSYTLALVVNDGRFDSRPASITVKVTDPSPVGGEVAGGTLPALTPAVSAILQTRNCQACHALDRKLVGPSFQDIANKYRSSGRTVADLVTQLSTSIGKGSSGKWGPVPMPPSPQVTAEELGILTNWLVGR